MGQEDSLGDTAAFQGSCQNLNGWLRHVIIYGLCWKFKVWLCQHGPRSAHRPRLVHIALILAVKNGITVRGWDCQHTCEASPTYLLWGQLQLWDLGKGGCIHTRMMMPDTVQYTTKQPSGVDKKIKHIESNRASWVKTLQWNKWWDAQLLKQDLISNPGAILGRG